MFLELQIVISCRDLHGYAGGNSLLLQFPEGVRMTTGFTDDLNLKSEPFKPAVLDLCCFLSIQKHVYF